MTNTVADNNPTLGWMMYMNDQTEYEVGETYTVWTFTLGMTFDADVDNVERTFVLAGA